MRIDEWFDIKNKDHIAAMKYLMDHGVWPVGFIPDGIEFRPSWYLSIVNKMAEEYCEQNG